MGKILTTQPFPFAQYDSETGGFVPCGSTLNAFYITGTATEMMKQYWRIKKFHITCSFTGHFFADPAQPTSDESFSFDVVSGASTEEDLVCSASLNTIQNLSKTSRITDISVNFTFGKGDYYFNSTSQENIKLYFGGFFFQCSNDDFSSFNSVYNPGVTNPLSNIIFNDYQLYQGETSFSPRPPNETPLTFWDDGSNTITNFSMSILASEYWSYGGTYNTSTGLPL